MPLNCCKRRSVAIQQIYTHVLAINNKVNKSPLDYLENFNKFDKSESQANISIANENEAEKIAKSLLIGKSKEEIGSL